MHLSECVLRDSLQVLKAVSRIIAICIERITNIRIGMLKELQMIAETLVFPDAVSSYEMHI